MHPVTLQEPFRAVFYAPFYAALARGAYAAEGVEVRLLSGAVPSLAKDVVLGGEADLAWGGPMRLLLVHDKDPACPLRLFGAVVMGDPFLILGRAPRPDFALTDLAALTFGTVSEVPTPWWTLQDDIRRAGLDPDSIRRVTDAGMDANAAALLAGTIDCAQLFEPYATRLEDAGCAVWYAQASRGPTSYTAFYARDDVIAARRPEFEAMVRGLAATLAWFADASDEECAREIAIFFPDMVPSLLARCIGRYRSLGIWTETPRFPPEALARLETAMLSAGAISRTPGFAGLVAEEVTEAALA
ncbi:ABC transporter substrate-binding protein [Plastoroseomonas hellenica]|uniref:ABC transporter substrate-binding protein n=1 Tax=Plastoroseomonas hellenica TaxID=2687306 RepID=UPI001BAA8452|nr:ABC transporter substrate-binding protein [Plastoroseomonas hellenica]MBR0647794.1 ABC transporter substrate-binding protein [Plastoroseomonas hellenica]